MSNNSDGSRSFDVPAAEITTITLPLTRNPVLIRRLAGVNFAFDRSLIEPCGKEVLRSIAEFAAGQPDGSLLIAGHTDNTGSRSYNNRLSARRARVVYAYVTFGISPAHRTASLNTWQSVRREENWGRKEMLLMLQSLGFFAGDVDTAGNAEAETAIRAFQTSFSARHADRPIAVNGRLNTETWSAAFETYMETDGATIPEEKFFGFNAADPFRTVEDHQNRRWIACGEDHLLEGPSQAGREERNRANRRVEFLFFQPGAGPNPVNCDLYNNFITIHFTFPITVEGTIRFDCRTPFANRDFVLITPDGHEHTVTTDADGNFQHDSEEGLHTLQIEGDFKLRRRCDEIGRHRSNLVCRSLSLLDRRFDVQISRSLSDFVAVSGNRLRRGDSDFCFFGSNAYYLLEQTANDRFRSEALARRQVRDFFCLMETACINVVRTWGFNDDQNKPIETRTQTSPGVFGQGLDALDLIIQEARLRGIRLIVTLTNYWHDYGGISQYARWAGYNTSLGNGDPDHLVEELFYTGSITSDATAANAVTDDPRTRYRAYACHLLNRYREEPAILAWELINEPRARAEPLTGSTRDSRRTVLSQALRTWIGDTSEHFRNNCNPRQLLSIGGVDIENMIFFYGDARVRRFIDLVDTHIYPTHFADYNFSNRTCRRIDVRFRPREARRALRRAAELGVDRVGKPFYLGEFGIGFMPLANINASPDTSAENRVKARAWLQRRPQFESWSNLLRGFNSSGMLFWQLLPESRPTFDPNEVQMAPQDSATAPLRGVAPQDAADVAAFVNGALPLWRACGTPQAQLELDVFDAEEIAGLSGPLFAASRITGRHVTIIAHTIPPSAVSAGVTWNGGVADPNPERRRVSRASVGSSVVEATVGSLTDRVVIHVAEIVRFRQTRPSKNHFDELSDPTEPVLRVCDLDPVRSDPPRIHVDVNPNATTIVFEADPASVVQLSPPQRAGDGEVSVSPRPLPAGTDVAAGLETTLFVRSWDASGPRLTRNNRPARVRIREFQRIDIHLFLHVVRRNNGSMASGVTMTEVVRRLNEALGVANRIWGQTCIRLRMRQRAGTALKTENYSEADLAIDFIDHTAFLEITRLNGTFAPQNEHQAMFSHGLPAGRDRNSDNPTFVNIYVIEEFLISSGALGGVAGVGENWMIIERENMGDNTLFAHELSHNLNLRDLEVRGVTQDLEKRLLRSQLPRGEFVTSGGTAGDGLDETLIVRTQAMTYSGPPLPP